MLMLVPGDGMAARLVAEKLQPLISPDQQRLRLDWDERNPQIPEEWHQVAMKYRKAKGCQDVGSVQLLMIVLRRVKY